MKHNISRELSNSVAQKRRAEEKRRHEEKRNEHLLLTKQAAGNKRSREVEISRESTSAKYFPYLKMALVTILLLCFGVTSAGVLKKISVNTAREYSTAQGLIFDPYKSDSKTRDQLKAMEDEIPGIIEKSANPSISTLKAQMVQPFKFDIVSISKSDAETCATVEFINQETSPIAVVFRWNMDGKFINLKY